MKTRALGVAAAALCVMMGAGPEDGPFKGQPGGAAKPAVNPVVRPQPAGGVQKGVNVAQNGPGQVVQTFLTHVRNSEGCRAIDECFDLESFSRASVPGYSKLSAADRTYVRQMVAVLLKATVVSMPESAELASKLKGPGIVNEHGDEATVVLEFVKRAEQIPVKLAKTPSGWKIVDIGDLGDRLKQLSAMESEKKKGSTWSMEDLLAFALMYKHNPNVLKNQEQLHTNAIEGNLRAQTQSIQNQIELYYARTGHYPDLVKDGWNVLLKEGYMKKAPVNPVNKSSSICEAGKGNGQCGWEYDLKTGTFGACYFDEASATLTMETP